MEGSEGSAYPGYPFQGARGKALLLDAAAFFAALQLQLHGVELYSTDSVLSEVRDSESKSRLELARLLGRVKVVSPPPHYKSEARRAATELGDIISLSEADLDVIAAALYLREEMGLDVVVLTDDYSLQNVLRHLGVEFRSVRTLGIREVRRYVVYCPGCGRRVSPKARTCPYCGTALRKRRAER